MSVWPGAGHQIGLRDDLAGPLCKRNQKVKRAIADRDRAASLRELASDRVEAKWPEGQDRPCAAWQAHKAAPLLRLRDKY
jgi:hypothetical protein